MYHQALTLTPDRREAFVQDACAADADLCRQAMALLRANDDAGDFMNAPAIDLVARILADDRRSVPSQVGRYRVLSLLGRGGMGEVFLAEDPLLRRKVALKLLRPSLTADTRALVRFEQEACAASSLNHPNIVTIHEIGEADSGRFIAMEFVDGQPLSALVGAPMPVPSLLSIGLQVAQALAVAHASGIVHRDIKPANIMLRTDGYVKVLDFGIARLGAADEASVDNAEPRIGRFGGDRHQGLTQAGVLLGTPGYMSPEQIRHEQATAASDVYALGAVLHELSTATHPSDGKASRGESHGAVIHDEFAASPSIALPQAADELVARMLRQDPAARPSTAEVVQSLESLSRSTTVQHRARHAPSVLIAIAAVAVLVAAATLLTWFAQMPDRQPSATAPIRFAITPPPNAAFAQSSASLAISPDGRSIAFTASEGLRPAALWIQPLDSLQAKRLDDTEGAAQIFWSPDSRALAFMDYTANFVFKTVDLANGRVRVVPDVTLGGSNIGTWSSEQGILVKGENVIQRIPPGDGTLENVTRLDAAFGETEHSFPTFLPDGRHFLFLASSREPQHDGVAYVAAVDSTERRRLLKSDSQVVYAAPGYLLYMIGFTLFAQPFDTKTLQVTGEAVPIAEEVERTSGSLRGAFTVSQTGVLAYRRHNETQLVWVDRNGRRLRTLGPHGHYRNPALSPDQRTVAVTRLNPKTESWDIWTLGVESNTAAGLTAHQALDDMPVWSPDGTRIAFFSDRPVSPISRGGFYEQRPTADEPELLLPPPGSAGPAALHAWTPDGLYYSIDTNSSLDLFRLPLSADRRAVPLVTTPFQDAFGQPSPDGRWIAYASNESGRFQIYAARLPSAAGKQRLSVEGGTEPFWRRDGKELFYLSPERQIVSVRIDSGAELKVGTPRPLFDAAVSSLTSPAYTRNQYLVTGDGQRFLMTVPVRGASLSEITVVVNWPSILRNRES